MTYSNLKLLFKTGLTPNEQYFDRFLKSRLKVTSADTKSANSAKFHILNSKNVNDKKYVFLTSNI